MDQNQTDNKIKPQPTLSQPQASRGLGEKEKEVAGSKEVAIETVGKEIEPAKELEKVGIELKKEEVKLPPAVEKMGVRPSGAAAPAPPPAVTLPLTDDQVVKGLAFPIVSSLRWLAEFCLRQLKKAHIGLKKIHGKMVRVRS